MAHKGQNQWTEFGNFQSNGDLSSAAYLVCKVSTDGTDVDIAAAAGQNVVGIFGQDVDDYSSLATGQYGTPEVITSGETTAIAGGALNAGVYCTATSAGKLVAASTELAICQTLEQVGALNDQIRVRVCRVYIP